MTGQQSQESALLLQDAFGSAQNKAGHHAESAKDQGKGLFESAQDKANSFLDTAGDKAHGAKHDAKVLHMPFSSGVSRMF